jgi:hypothetical protein
MPRAHHRMRVVLVGVVAGGAALLALGGTLAARTAAPKRVGVAAPGRSALELVGKVVQSGNSFVGFGYVTHVAGIPDARLFTDPNKRDEAHARITFYGTARVTGRSTLANEFVLTLSGPTSYYFQATPHGSFATPTSFRLGRRVAVFATRIHDGVTVLAPNAGIATATEELSETALTTFRIAGTRYRLGVKGVHLRLDATGSAQRTSLAPLVSTTVFSAVATVTG